MMRWTRISAGLLLVGLLLAGTGYAGQGGQPCGEVTGKPCSWGRDLVCWAWVADPIVDATHVEITCGPMTTRLPIEPACVVWSLVTPGRGTTSCTVAPVTAAGVVEEASPPRPFVLTRPEMAISGQTR